MLSVRSAFLVGSAAAMLACAETVTEPPVCELEVTLLPGEALMTNPTSTEPGCGLLLPSGAPGSRYRVAVLRPDSADPAATSVVTLVVEGLGVSGPATVDAQPPGEPWPGAPSPAAPLQKQTELSGSGDGAFHAALRKAEETLVQQVGTAGLLSSRPMPLLGGLHTAPAAPRVVYDPGTSCSAPRSPRTALLRGENDVMAIYQDSAEIAVSPVSDEHVQRMLAFYAVYGRETVETYFGRMPDVDGNGRVVVILTSHPFTDDSVVGYVWAGNFYARSSCAASDEMEVIYLNPARVRSMDRGEYVALGVLSHESQHLVSLFHRLARTRRRNSSTFLSHPVWMEEGRAELADEVTSRRAWSSQPLGPARTAVVGGAELEQGLRSYRAETYGVALEALRTIWYLSSQPNGLAVTPEGAIREADIRNGGWHFHRWIGDAFGRAHTAPGADAALFRSLTDSLTASGAEGLGDVLGKSFGELLEAFVAAVMLHGTGAPTGPADFTTYDFVSLTAVLGTSSPGLYPWPVTASGSGPDAPLTRSFQSARYTGSIGPTGVRIHDFTSNGTGVGARLTVESSVPVRLIVVRIR